MDVERFRVAAPKRQEVRARWGAGPEAFVFVKVARLAPLKGHEWVLPAFAEVVGNFPYALLVLLGDGVLRERLEKAADRLGMADRVRFCGLVPPEEIPGALWAADAVVHASIREGLARVLVQAGLCERPVVTYNVGGAPEVVTDGVNGFLLRAPEPGSSSRAEAHRLAEAMGRLAADGETARQMGRRWPAKILGQFDGREMVRRTEQVYEEVLYSASASSIGEDP